MNINITIIFTIFSSFVKKQGEKKIFKKKSSCESDKKKKIYTTIIFSPCESDKKKTKFNIFSSCLA